MGASTRAARTPLGLPLRVRPGSIGGSTPNDARGPASGRVLWALLEIHRRETNLTNDTIRQPLFTGGRTLAMCTDECTGLDRHLRANTVKKPGP
jgi:hypothetical protein